MPAAQLSMSGHLSKRQAEDVAGLHTASTEVDGVSALSEQTLLSVAPGSSSVQHVLAYEGEQLAGYAQVSGASQAPGDAESSASAELVVAPEYRRQGIGSSLWEAVASMDPAARVWAHGNLPGAQGLAAARGLVVVRELHKMARPLSPADTRLDQTLPPGFAARAFDPGRDEQAWVAANAEAFASHPEQGRLTLADLRARMAQPWFRPNDLILVDHESGTTGTRELAAFHWTKIDPEQRSSIDPTTTAGEVYVLGVRPAYQGRGLATPLTKLGLAHLAAQGLREVVLYVDGDNEPALRTYRHTGFTSIMVDVMYSHRVHEPLSG